MPVYRGRLAPSPTGFLHLGHARTFWIAQERARQAGGALILRNDDLDRARCRLSYVAAMMEDLHWFGLRWIEGPDAADAYGPYSQSARLSFYRIAFEQLRADGAIYPCQCSRKDVRHALSAPHQGNWEPIYPGTCRPSNDKSQLSSLPRSGVNWRFRVTPGERIDFEDGIRGRHAEIAAESFGDFVVWRKDDLPSYQFACTVDDAAMKVTEVVRGEDLLLSTCQQLLLYRALALPPPRFAHCDLVTDEQGNRLAKRSDAYSLRAFRAAGYSPEELRQSPHFIGKAV